MTQGSWGQPSGQPSASPYGGSGIGPNQPYGGAQAGSGSSYPGPSGTGSYPGTYPPAPPPRKGFNLGLLLPILVGAIVLGLGATLIVLKLQSGGEPTTPPVTSTAEPTGPSSSASTALTCSEPATPLPTAPTRSPGQEYKMRVIVKSETPVRIYYTLGAERSVSEEWSGGGQWCREATVGPHTWVSVNVYSKDYVQTDLTCTIQTDGKDTKTGSSHGATQDCSLFTPRS